MGGIAEGVRRARHARVSRRFPAPHLGRGLALVADCAGRIRRLRSTELEAEGRAVAVRRRSASQAIRSGLAGGAAAVPARRCGRTPRGAPAPRRCPPSTRIRAAGSLPPPLSAVAPGGRRRGRRRSGAVVAAVTSAFPGAPAASPACVRAPARGEARARARAPARSRPPCFGAGSRRGVRRRRRLPDLRARRSEPRGDRGPGRDPRRGRGPAGGRARRQRPACLARARVAAPGAAAATSRCRSPARRRGSTRRWRRCARRSAAWPPRGSRPTRSPGRPPADRRARRALADRRGGRRRAGARRRLGPADARLPPRTPPRWPASPRRTCARAAQAALDPKREIIAVVHPPSADTRARAHVVGSPGRAEAGR